MCPFFSQTRLNYNYWLINYIQNKSKTGRSFTEDILCSDITLVLTCRRRSLMGFKALTSYTAQLTYERQTGQLGRQVWWDVRYYFSRCSETKFDSFSQLCCSISLKSDTRFPSKQHQSISGNTCTWRRHTTTHMHKREIPLKRRPVGIHCWNATLEGSTALTHSYAQERRAFIHCIKSVCVYSVSTRSLFWGEQF